MDSLLSLRRAPAPEGRLANVRARLDTDLGKEFVCFLVFVYVGLKGFAMQLVTSAQLPMFRHLGVSGTNFQLATLISSMPWATKGWVGVLSDCFPLGRYHKRGYLIISAVLAIAGISGILVAPVAMPSRGCWWALAALFLLPNLQYATFDLLSEASYTRLMRQQGAGPEVVSLVWVCVSLGSLSGSCIVGMVVDRYGPEPLVFLALFPAIYSVWLSMAGGLPDQPVLVPGVQWGKLASEPRLFLLASCMAAGAILVALTAALCAVHVQLSVALAVSGGLASLSFLALPRTLAKSNLYMFLSSAVYLDLSGPLSYFYTADSDCVRNGPNFSYAYYLALTSIVGSVAGSLGSILFQGMQRWTFRQAFLLTVVVQVAASVFDLVLVQRWNLAAGFSDKAVFLFGDAACQPMVGMLAMMPQVLLNSRLCPRGAEATVYAILAGFQNFGQSVAAVLGVFFVRHLGVRDTIAGNGDGCDFDSLSMAIVGGHVLLPLMSLPLIFVLIPNTRLDDHVAFEEVSPVPSFCSPAPSQLDGPCSRSWSSDSEGVLSDVEVDGFADACIGTEYRRLADGPEPHLSIIMTSSVQD